QYFFYRDGEIRSAQLRIFPEEQEYFLTRSRPWTEQSRVYLLRNYLDAVKYLPQDQIAALCPGADGYILHHMEEGTPGDYDRVITYGPGGVGEIDGWYIHLQVQPLWDGTGTGDKVVDVFYGGAKRDGNVYRWYDRNTEPIGGAPVTLEAFPDVTFQAPGGSVYATVTDPETGAVGASMLLSGMPVADAFFCDVTGDGYPEICVTSYFGSGIIDEHVQVYDYARGERWVLQDRMRYDYRFWEETAFCGWSAGITPKRKSGTHCGSFAGMESSVWKTGPCSRSTLRRSPRRSRATMGRRFWCGRCTAPPGCQRTGNIVSKWTSIC
ncbi:MAG: hypothetical protein IIW32_02270, partial [Bacteroides sp.]|nr:hypothetical protein [Bacteroides sp.]